jgi:hypothetical protein
MVDLTVSVALSLAGAVFSVTNTLALAMRSARQVGDKAVPLVVTESGERSQLRLR